jgi:WD40 repeat protein/serine/threonine protein kinase
MQSADLSGKFQEVLANYLEARERGESVDPQALLRAHPDLADELKEYFANDRQIAAAAGSIIPPPRKHGGANQGPMRIGEYELLGEIARGGMGVVYRARHLGLQRLVALKMLLGGEFAGPDGVRRFRAEAEVVAELDHPHIVPIYDLGIHEGQAFFCMKLIDGPSLKQQIGAYAGRPEAATRLIIQVAHAVHHAHQRGILHRDIKPGNILLQTADARPSDKNKKNALKGTWGTPYVTDFGLAKRFRADGKASHSTAIVGTAAYMAPEQATGQQALTVTADVYSLGAVLFELLTGRPPFVGQNHLEILLQVVEKEAPSPLTLRPDVDPDLAQICLKCLRKNPEERYPSAGALALELSQWRAGETLTVRAPTRAERLWRTCRRHPFRVFSGLLVLGALLAIVGLSVAGNWYLSDLNEQLQESNRELTIAKESADANEARAIKEAENARQSEAERVKQVNQARLAWEAAEKSRLKADQAEIARKASEYDAELAKVKAMQDRTQALLESRRLLVQHYVANGQQLLQRGELFGAALWFGEALKQDPDHEELHRIRLGTTLRQCPQLAQMWFTNDKIRLMRLSPAGDRLLTAGKETAASLWDTKTGKVIGEPLRHDSAIASVEFSPDGRLILTTAAGDNMARVWSAASALPHGSPLKHSQAVHAAVFSPDNKWIATASADKTAHLWDAATTKSAGKPLLHEQAVRVVAFHPDGKRILTVSENQKKKKEAHVWGHVWDLGKQTSMSLTGQSIVGVRAAGFSKDGKHIYTINGNHHLRLWDTATGLPDKKLSADLKVKGADGILSPALDKLLQPTENDLKIIDLPGGTTAHTLHNDGPISLAQFSPGGHYLVTASPGRGVKLWQADTYQPFGPPLPSGQAISLARFSKNEQWLATFGEDRCIRLWNLAWPDRDRPAATPKHVGKLLASSPDGTRALLAIGTSLVAWDAARGHSLGTVSFTGSMPQARWSNDNRLVALAQREEVRLWNLTGKSTVLSQAWKQDEAPHVQFSADGKLLSIWSKHQAGVWDLAGKPVAFKKIASPALALDADGARLAVWKKTSLEIQELASGKTIALPIAGVPESFRFSPDRRSGVSAFADGSLVVWDLAQKKPATPVFWHGEPVRQLVYSADGRFLASAGASGHIRVWDSATGLPLSPVLTAPGSLADLSFRLDDTMLAALTNDGRVQRWSMQPLAGKLSDIVTQLHLAAGQELQLNGDSLVPLDAARLNDLWQQARR